MNLAIYSMPKLDFSDFQCRQLSSRPFGLGAKLTVSSICLKNVQLDEINAPFDQFHWNLEPPIFAAHCLTQKKIRVLQNKKMKAAGCDMSNFIYIREKPHELQQVSATTPKEELAQAGPRMRYHAHGEFEPPGFPLEVLLGSDRWGVIAHSELMATMGEIVVNRQKIV